MRKNTCTTAALTASLAFALTVAPSMVRANEGPKVAPVQLQPAKRYSGATPIDMDNGLEFNNGTYGLPNAEYESWSTSRPDAPGLSSKPYPYTDKERFLGAIEDRLNFYEAAITNWNHSRAADAKPEVVEYAKQATQTIQPKLDAARKALLGAKNAGSNDWTKAEGEARQSFLDLQGTYRTLHGNAH